jgi:hypothetical protein
MNRRVKRYSTIFPNPYSEDAGAINGAIRSLYNIFPAHSIEETIAIAGNESAVLFKYSYRSSLGTKSPNGLPVTISITTSSAKNCTFGQGIQEAKMGSTL